MIRKDTITDLSYLQEASNYNEEFIKEMIHIFLRQTPGYLDDIRMLAKEKEWDKVKALLHKLKPTMPMMGIKEGEKLVLNLESDVKALINLDKVMPRLKELENICEMAYIELKSYL